MMIEEIDLKKSTEYMFFLYINNTCICEMVELSFIHNSKCGNEYYLEWNIDAPPLLVFITIGISAGLFRKAWSLESRSRTMGRKHKKKHVEQRKKLVQDNCECDRDISY